MQGVLRVTGPSSSVLPCQPDTLPEAILLLRLRRTVICQTPYCDRLVSELQREIYCTCSAAGAARFARPASNSCPMRSLFGDDENVAEAQRIRIKFSACLLQEVLSKVPRCEANETLYLHLKVCLAASRPGRCPLPTNCNFTPSAHLRARGMHPIVVASPDRDPICTSRIADRPDRPRKQ